MKTTKADHRRLQRQDLNIQWLTNSLQHIESRSDLSQNLYVSQLIITGTWCFLATIAMRAVPALLQQVSVSITKKKKKTAHAIPRHKLAVLQRSMCPDKELAYATHGIRRSIEKNKGTLNTMCYQTSQQIASLLMYWLIVTKRVFIRQNTWYLVWTAINNDNFKLPALGCGCFQGHFLLNRKGYVRTTLLHSWEEDKYHDVAARIGHHNVPISYFRRSIFRNDLNLRLALRLQPNAWEGPGMERQFFLRYIDQWNWECAPLPLPVQRIRNGVARMHVTPYERCSFVMS